MNATTGDSRGNDLTYVSEDMGFKIDFPKEWQKGHLVKENDNSLEVYSRQIIKNSNFEGLIFSIDRRIGELVTEEDIEREPMPLRIVSQENGYTYVLRKPSDMQYPPENEELSECYRLFQTFIDDVVESFEIVEDIRPVSDNIGFKVVGSTCFTVEIPKQWDIETVEDSLMTWRIFDNERHIGFIEFIPYFQEVEPDNESSFVVENKKLLRKAVIKIKPDILDERIEEVVKSMKIIGGPFTAVDMLTNYQQYVYSGCMEVLGDIEDVEYADGKPVRILIDEKNFIRGDYPNGFKLEDVSQEPAEYIIGESCKILPLVYPNYTNYGKYAILSFDEFAEFDPTYDVLLYKFLVNDNNEVMMVIGRYIP